MNLTTARPHDALLPYLADTELGRHVRHHIQENGYVVLEQVLTREECAVELARLWDFVEATAPGVLRDDPDTWYPPAGTAPEDAEATDPWPHSGWKFLPDMCQSFQAGWLFGALREVLADRVFSKIYGTRELHSSKEGFTFHRPTAIGIAPSGGVHPVLEQERPRVCGQIQSNGNGEHFDQCAADTGLHCIQSSTALLDQSEGDGCFVCWPKSHRQHAELTRNIWRGRSDWVPLMDSELDQLKQLGLSSVKVPVSAGDVILWRSDLAHCGAGPSTPREGFRAVSYTCMLPAAMTPQDVMDGKIDEYLIMQTGDHRPNVKSRHFAKSKMKKKKKKKTEEEEKEEKEEKKRKEKKRKEKKKKRKEEEGGREGGGGEGEGEEEGSKVSGGGGGGGANSGTKKEVGESGVKIARGKYFGEGLPPLTRRQQELYGIVKYGGGGGSGRSVGSSASLQVLLLLCVLATTITTAAAGARKKSTPQAKMLKYEKNLIKCDVCNLGVGSLFDAQEKAKDLDELLNFADQVCDPTSETGALWSSVDVQRKEGSISSLKVMDRRPYVQMCGSECIWSSKICETLVEDYSEDMGEYDIYIL